MLERVLCFLLNDQRDVSEDEIHRDDEKQHIALDPHDTAASRQGRHCT